MLLWRRNITLLHTESVVIGLEWELLVLVAVNYIDREALKTKHGLVEPVLDVLTLLWFPRLPRFVLIFLE